MTALEDLERLAEWVAIPSVSGDEKAFATFLEKTFRADGLKVTRIPVAPGRFNLLVSARPKPRLLFCSHLDTVPPFLPPQIRGKTLWGRGSSDAKGAIYAMRKAVLALEEAGVTGSGLLLLVGEEVDHVGAKAAKAAKIRCQTIVVGEPTRNRFLPAQKGTLKVRYRAKGVAGHSAFPDKGRSAIHLLVRELNEVLDADLPSDPHIGVNTVNIGHVSGGVADNVFAPAAEARAFFRTTVPSRTLLQLLKTWKGEHIRIDKLAASDPLRYEVPAWGAVGEVAAFNTDAPYLKGCYKRAFLAGPGDIRDAHSPRERVSARELKDAAALYRRLAEEELA